MRVYVLKNIFVQFAYCKELFYNNKNHFLISHFSIKKSLCFIVPMILPINLDNKNFIKKFTFLSTLKFH